MRRRQVPGDVGGHVLVGHQARHQAVDLDAVGAPLDGERLGQVLHAGLRRRGVREPGPTGPGVGGTHVDDRPGLARREQPTAVLPAHEERAVEGDVDDRAPRVGGQILAGRREVGRRVVDQHTGQAEAGLDPVEGRGDAVRVADVALDDLHRCADRRDRVASRLEVLRLAGEDRQVGAQSGELGGDRLAQAGAASGDDDRHAVVGAGHERGGAGCGGMGEPDQLGHVGPVLRRSMRGEVSCRCSGADGLRRGRPGTRRSRRCG